MVKERLSSPLGTVYADGLTVMEIEGLIELLDEQVVSDEVAGGYRVTGSGPGYIQPARPYSCMGPGIASWPGDVPSFEQHVHAEAMCRCLGRAFRAGENHRAGAIKALLEQRR